MLLPQELIAEEITLTITDLQKIYTILQQTLEDLIFLSRSSLLCPFLEMISQSPVKFVVQENIKVSILLHIFSHDNNIIKLVPVSEI